MERCLNCMREHKDNVRFCPYCGYQKNNKVEGYELPPGTKLESRYIIGTTIGIGGFGIIYKAWDKKLNTVVAVKECFPEKLVTRSPGQVKVNVVNNSTKERKYKEKIRRFLGEAQTMARFCEHENIVHVFDFFEANNTAYFVMEYLDGVNIRKYMENNKISVDQAVDIVAKICSILAYMHKEDIIHRDIKPDNIMICKNGNIKLIDFGTARSGSGELSKAIEAELTPGYAPPEQYPKNGCQGPWTDIYALCATLYNMVTGKKPDESTDLLKENNLISPMKINPEIPEWLDRTIMSGMATDYHLRIQNTEELLSCLHQKKKVLYPEELIRKQKRNKMLFIAAAIFVVMLGFCGVVANTARYHAWFVENGTISVWLPDNSFGVSMKDVAKKYETRYGGKKVEISLINEMTYSTQISEAADKGNLPDVFFVPESEFSATEHLADVRDILHEIGDDNHFLIKHNKSYLYEKNMIPLSFNTLVLFENTSISQSTDSPYDLSKKFDLRKIKPSPDKKHTLFDRSSHLAHSVISPKTDSDGVQDALYEFSDSEKQDVPYYFGSTSDRRTIQNSLAGYNEIHGVFDGDNMYAEFCDALYINKDSYENKKQLIQLWTSYLLSEDAQSLLYLQNDRPLPIERDTYNEYVGIINSLSFLDGEYEHFEIVN